VTEVAQEGFELFEAVCTKIGLDDYVDVGEFDGSSVSFEVDGSEFASHDCTLVNARSPENGGQTLPPTDAVEPDRALGGDSWPKTVLVLASVLAAALVSVPVLGTRRAVSRRR
jgi:hypothetical protein